MWRSHLYEPVRHLAYGYQSHVWLARDVATKDLVTIKGTDLACIESRKTLDHLKDEQRTLECLARELKKFSESPQNTSIYRFNASALRIAKLLKVFHETKHLGLTEGLDGVVYFVFEFIAGATLNKHIAVEKGLHEETVKFYAAELIRILGALHERGFVYRDLKASNIIIEPNGRLKLIDFGFAKHIGVRGRTRSYCGTLHAMPPEVLIKGRLIGSESDLASLWSLEQQSLTTLAEADQKSTEQAMIDQSSVISMEQEFSDNEIEDQQRVNDKSKKSVVSVARGVSKNIRNWSSSALFMLNHSQILPIPSSPFAPKNSCYSSHPHLDSGDGSFSEMPKSSSSRALVVHQYDSDTVNKGESEFVNSRYNRERGSTDEQCGATIMDNSEKPSLLETCTRIVIDTPLAVPNQQNTLTQSHIKTTSASSPNFGREIGLSKLTLLPTDTYGTEVDWWSLGVLVYEMIYCHPPFGYYDYTLDKCRTIEQLADKSPDSIFFSETPAISSTAKNFIKDLLQSDRRLRLGIKNDAREVQQHSWFSKFEWDKLSDPNYGGPKSHQFLQTEY